MKKIYALLLSLLVIFSIAACGNQNSENNAAISQSTDESMQELTK